MLIMYAKGPEVAAFNCGNSGLPKVYARFGKNGVLRGQI
jgi:hypothetical protein